MLLQQSKIILYQAQTLKQLTEIVCLVVETLLLKRHQRRMLTVKQYRITQAMLYRQSPLKMFVTVLRFLFGTERSISGITATRQLGITGRQVLQRCGQHLHYRVLRLGFQ